MREFKEAYKCAVDRLPKYHISAERVRDELHHRRLVRRKRRRTAAQTAAAALFLVCGVGTATAMNYSRSIFEVTENGFTAVSEGAQVLEEENDTGVEPKAAVYGAAEDFSGTAPKEDAPQDEVEILEAREWVPEEYASVEEFEEKEDIVVAVPDLALLGEEPMSENVMVFEEGERVMVTVNYEDRSFFLSQWDHRDSRGYASSTMFSGESVNERRFVNDQGLEYVMFDTLDNGEITFTHAVISVNGRDLQLDFGGYDEVTVETVLRKLDLSVYFKDE